jgi:uncharacterized protein
VIIDVHGHVGPWFFPMRLGGVEENLRLLDRYGIDLQVVSASEAVVYDPPAGNRALAAALEGVDRLRGYVTVSPRDLAAAEADLRALIPTGRFVGAKIHTAYTATPVGHPAMAELLRLLAELDVVALLHTWGPEVLALAELVEAIPGSRVIMAHLGGPAWDLGIEAAAGCERLWVEPCGSYTDRGRIAAAARRLAPHQLLFGTDATLIDPAVALGCLADADLPADLAERMRWRNAADLLDLGLCP